MLADVRMIIEPTLVLHGVLVPAWLLKIEVNVELDTLIAPKLVYGVYQRYLMWFGGKTLK